MESLSAFDRSVDRDLHPDLQAGNPGFYFWTIDAILKQTDVTRAIRGTCTHRFLGTGEAPRCLGLNGKMNVDEEVLRRDSTWTFVLYPLS